MIDLIYMVLITLSIIIFSFPRLMKNKQYKEVAISSIALLIATITCVLYSLKLFIFDPTEWIGKLFGPLSKAILSLFQT